MTNKRTKSASVLLFVMVLIFAASAILVSIGEYASVALRSRASSAKEFDLRLDAYNALNVAIAVIEEYSEIDGGIFSELQGWGKPFAEKRITLPSGADAEVVIVDESGKIPLRAMNAQRLQKILEAFELSEHDALMYAEHILDWIDTDDNARVQGAEYQDYDTFEAQPLNRAMESFREMLFIKEVQEVFFDEQKRPTELYKKFTEVFSLEPFEKTNLNSASLETLRVLMEAEEKDSNESAYQELYQALRGESGTITDGIVWCKNASELQSRGVSNYPTIGVDYKVQLLKIIVNIKRGLGQYKLVAYYASPSEYSATMLKGMKNSSSTTRSTRGNSNNSRSKSSGDDAKTIDNNVINSKAKSASKKGAFKVVKIREFF